MGKRCQERHNSRQKGETCNGCGTMDNHNALHSIVICCLFLPDSKMASKRGRPILEDDRDAAIERRRIQTRERMRQLRQRQREGNDSIAARTAEQLAQGEQIINFTTSTEDDAAATLLQLGLRVQDLTLPQNPTEAELQRNATDADEHHEIYPEIERAQNSFGESRLRVRPGFFKQFARRPPQETQEQDEDPQGQTPLARYFPSLPARSGTENRTTRRVSSPTRDDLLQAPVAGSSIMTPEPNNNELSVENLAVANQQESAHNWSRQESREEGSVGSVNTNVDYGWSAI